MKQVIALLLLNLAGSIYAQSPNYNLRPVNFGLRLPDTNDPTLRRLLYSSNSIFYQLPQVYQRDGYVYTTEFLKDFNANLDFPWETTVGLNIAHRRGSKDNPYRTINVFRLPDGLPILVLPGRPVRWIFPEGAVFGEIIYVFDGNNRWVQEVRTRTKETGSIYWTPDVYRPIGTKEEFLQLTGLPNLTWPKKHFFFRNPEEDQVQKLEGDIERLPNIPKETVRFLLNRPFRNVTEDKWTPMADQDFHILPKDYTLGLVKFSSTSCLNCHKQSGISVANLIPREPLIRNNPQKVGSIRGYDGIFSWHPFDESSVSTSPFSPKRVILRQFDLQNNYVKLFDRSMIRNGEVIYNGHRYVLTREVQQALKGPELPESVFLHRIAPPFTLLGR